MISSQYEWQLEHFLCLFSFLTNLFQQISNRYLIKLSWNCEFFKCIVKTSNAFYKFIHAHIFAYHQFLSLTSLTFLIHTGLWISKTNLIFNNKVSKSPQSIAFSTISIRFFFFFWFNSIHLVYTWKHAPNNETFH